MIDEDGYLMDQFNNYVLDDNGNKMRLSENDIEVVKQNGMYEEQSFLEN